MTVDTIVQEQADAVMAGLVGGAMARCPKCDTNNLSVGVHRDDVEHPDELYKCKCGTVWTVFVPENRIHCRTLIDGWDESDMIPVSNLGEQMAYAWYGAGGRMRPNFVFEDTLTFVDTERGRSSFCVRFRRQSTGTMVSAMNTDFKQLVPVMVNGSVTGKFTFCKRGTAYGVKLFQEKKQRAVRTPRQKKPKRKP